MYCVEMKARATSVTSSELSDAPVNEHLIKNAAIMQVAVIYSHISFKVIRPTPCSGYSRLHLHRGAKLN